MIERLSQVALLMWVVAGAVGSESLRAEPTPDDTASSAPSKHHERNGTEASADETASLEQRRRTAVTLNYCRAAFRRIQRRPSQRVLLEERDRILNNLNLSMVADEEIVKLYAAVLAEISETTIAGEERRIIRRDHQREFRHRVAGHITSFSVQMATGQYFHALKTGARSWWDYRTMVWNRSLDLWQIDKNRLQSINEKSTLFLDTFWKLTRKRGIPDKWLVRDDDLDRLDDALQETDPHVRLRVLKRMQTFLQCYPPYWYYVGRTQQALGQLKAAAETYRKLEQLGRGHFRKDELLAAAAANLAAIEDYHRRPTAVTTAQRALNYATDAWEVNVTCAVILHRHGQFQQAEDALLRNLDVGLETNHSLTALLELYVRRKLTKKIVQRLTQSQTLQHAAVPTLLRCVLLLQNADTRTPKTVRTVKGFVADSMSVEFDRRFGPDDVIVTATENWNLDFARVTFSCGSLSADNPAVHRQDGRFDARFRRAADLGSLFHPVHLTAPLQISVHYRDGTRITLHLQRRMTQRKATSPASAGTPPGGFATWRGRGHRTMGDYDFVAVDVGAERIMLNGTEQRVDVKDHIVPANRSTPSADHLPRLQEPPVQPPSRVRNSIEQPERGSSASPPAPPVSAPREGAPPSKQPSGQSEPERRPTSDASSTHQTPEDVPPGTDLLPPPPKRRK